MKDAQVLDTVTKKKYNILESESEDESSHNEQVFDKTVDYNFDIALKKNQFIGKKGAMLLELQKSYGNDERFKFDKRFKGDIDKSRVSDNVKSMTDLFDNDQKRKKEGTFYFDKRLSSFQEGDEFTEQLRKEKKRNLMILAQVVSNEEFFNNNKKVENPRNLLQKRYDPSMNIGSELVIERSANEKVGKTKNLVKLETGLGYNEYISSSKSINTAKEGVKQQEEGQKNGDSKSYRDKTRIKNEKTDSIMFNNNELDVGGELDEEKPEKEVTVDINYGFWKVFASKKKSKQLVSSNANNTNENEQQAADNLNDQNSFKKPKTIIINAAKLEEEKKVSREGGLLGIFKNQISEKKDKKSLTKAEKKVSKKESDPKSPPENEETISSLDVKNAIEKKKKKKLTQRQKSRVENVLRKNLEQEHGSDKATNYIRMIQLIKEKKGYKTGNKKKKLKSKNSFD